MEDKFDLHIKFTRTDNFTKYTDDELGKLIRDTHKQVLSLKKRKVALLFKLQEIIDTIESTTKNLDLSLSKLPIESLADLCNFVRRHDVRKSSDDMKKNLYKEKDKIFDEFDEVCSSLKIAEFDSVQLKSEVLIRNLG